MKIRERVIGPRIRWRVGLGVAAACRGCGKTQDFWGANNGQGVHKNGLSFCCQPCSEGYTCVCDKLRRGF